MGFSQARHTRCRQATLLKWILHNMSPLKQHFDRLFLQACCTALHQDAVPTCETTHSLADVQIQISGGWVGWREGGSHILEADLREVVERNIWNRFIWENKASRAPHYPARQRQHSLSSAQWHPNPYAPSLTWHRVNGMARPSACCRGLATPGGTRSILTFLSGDASSLLLPSAGAHDNLTVALIWV